MELLQQYNRKHGLDAWLSAAMFVWRKTGSLALHAVLMLGSNRYAIKWN